MNIVARLQETVTFAYTPHSSELSIQPLVEYASAVEPKEFVFKLHLETLGEDDENQIVRSWSYSKSLMSRYVYAPKADGHSVVRLPEIRLGGAVKELSILPVRWSGPGASPGVIFGEVWGVRLINPWREGATSMQGARRWERSE